MDNVQVKSEGQLFHGLHPYNVWKTAWSKNDKEMDSLQEHEGSM